jgi:uncharacterized protein
MRVLSISLGYSFLVLGALGLFLPFLQGILFLIIGLLILAPHANWADGLLRRLKAHHPRVARTIEHAEATSHRWLLRARLWFRRRFRGSAS